MFPTSNRRDFLGALIKGAAGLSLSLPYQGFAQGSGALMTTKLSDNLLQISGAGGNVVAVTGPDGVVLVNGGSGEHSASLLKLVSEQSPGKPIQALFNTDWHPEHTGSNETLGKAGAKIIAHENTKSYLSEDMFVDWQNRTYKARPKAALPNQTFYAGGKMTFGKERMEYAHLGQAHTDGDIYVFFPGPNVLMVGDALSVGKYPVADYTTGGWIGGLKDATKTLLSLANAETRVVPGVGPLQTSADLQAQLDMLTAMQDRLRQMMRQGMGPEDMLAAGITKEFDGKWGNPEVFVSVAWRGMWLHVRELGGIV